MLLSVTETATLLGITPRAVRGRLARGELPGRKQDGRWLVPREALPLPEDQHRALRARADEIREVVDASLPSRLATRRDRRRRSVVDLAAFRAGHQVASLLRTGTGPEVPRRDSVVAAVEQGLVALAVAFHEFGADARLAELVRARACFGRAVGLLLLDAPLPPGGPALDAADSLEQEVLPALAGLFRRAERARGRGTGDRP